MRRALAAFDGTNRGLFRATPYIQKVAFAY